ncbi:MAG: hypothetical protein GF353_24435 [Candidatus Lokiarchaeota archaeon]|nr:hypothetical protein [Candidatus Lokiarchaeota archaeon]
MIGYSKIKCDYVGPKAIFDPNFVPPVLLYRKKEKIALESIITDSIMDEFPLNILLQGIQGIGKKSIVNRVLEDLSNAPNTQNSFRKISIDCQEKNIEELIGSILAELNKKCLFNFNLSNLIHSNISDLWNTFKLASRKIQNELFIVFNNIEHLDPKVIKKFLHFGKEMNFTIISTINKILRTSTIDLISDFDVKNKLNYFSYNELNSILIQRASLTFLHDIDGDLIEYITDLIFEHYVPVPGKGIDIFRDIYPFLKKRESIKQFQLIQACQNHFDFTTELDDFSMFSYISDENFLTILFLDNLSNYFIKKSKYYITSKELKEIFDISCESLDYDKDIVEFNKIVKNLHNIGLINPSRKTLLERKYIPEDPLDCVHFFTVIDPTRLKAMVDAVFGERKPSYF